MKLETIEDFNDLIKESKSKSQKYYAIFKHSTRCPVSTMAKFSLRHNGENHHSLIGIFLVDIIRYRQLSNFIEEYFKIVHESPQLIVLKAGEVIYHRSHHNISAEELSDLN